MDEIALLTGLLERYSPTQSEGEAVTFLVDSMKAAGLRAHVDEIGNAIGVVGDGPRQIVLLGHIDTVSGFIPVTREGDRLNGRGAVDAKGPLATFAAAAARCVGQDLGDRQIVVIGAVGEEGDSRGAHFIKDRYRPAATIIGEPSSWEKITLGYKGSAWFDYRVKRILAHTSAQTESACEAAVAFWNAVKEWSTRHNAERPRMFDQVLPTLRRMSSDSNGFEEEASLHFGVRLPPGLGVMDLDAVLRGLAVDADLTVLDGVAAYRGDKNTSLVRAFLAAIRQHGGQPTFSVKSGTSDMNLVAPVWGTPILAYGPGDSTLDHTPDEHISIEEYVRAIGVLTDVLLRL